MTELTIGLDIVPSVGPGGLFTSGPVHCPHPAQLCRLAPGGYMTQTAGLVSRQNSDTFSGKILLRGWLNMLNIHKISKCNLRRKSPEDILYKSGRNLLIRNLLSRVNCLKIRLEIYSKFGANIFEIIFKHFRNNADTQHFSVLKGYLRFSRHFLVDTLI